MHSLQADLDRVVASLDDAEVTIVGWKEGADGVNRALGVAASDFSNIRSLFDREAIQLEKLRKQAGVLESGLSSTILNSVNSILELSGNARESIDEATQNLKDLR